MAKRGRPRHPDILTPREWDVLALLREALTNEQIAQRLGITERTAKFHVSEILSKLGVSTRQEAAAWQPEERRDWWAAVLGPLLPWRRITISRAAAAFAGGLIVAVLAGAGLLTWGLVRTDAGTASSLDGAPVVTPTPPGPVPLDVKAAQPGEYVVVYVRPISDVPLNAAVYARTVDARTQAMVEEHQLGGVLGGEPLPFNGPGAGPPALVGYGYGSRRPLDGQTEVIPFGEPAVAPQQWEGMPPMRGGANMAGVVYRQEAAGIVGRDAAGQVVATYAVPAPIPARPEDLYMNGGPVKIMISMDSASVAAVVPTSNGHVLAFVEGAAHSVVVDLTTGARRDLLHRSRVVAAALGEDGFAYAVLWNKWSGRYDFEAVKIDPITVRIVAQSEIAYPGPLNGDGALATPDGGVYFYLPTLGGDSLLYEIDPETAAATLVPLPPRLGLAATVGVDGKVYLYGGVGQNRVSVYDPATGQLQQDLPWLRAPEGTYVSAVFAR